jgi:hypothetical protein
LGLQFPFHEFLDFGFGQVTGVYGPFGDCGGDGVIAQRVEVVETSWCRGGVACKNRVKG